MADGIFLQDENIIISPNLDTWAQLGTDTDYPTWDDWQDWATNPDDLEWGSEIIDLDTVTTFTLQIETDGSGEVSYEVVVSNTGSFTGEETSTIINEGDVDIPAFTGRYVYVLTTISANGAQPALRTQTLTSSDATFRRRLLNQNTANWLGDASAKEVELDFDYSSVVAVFMTPYQPGGWVVDDYWADGYTETAPPIFPNIVEKSPQLKISLATYEGIYTNGQLDMEVVYLPAMSLTGGNLTRI